MFVLKSLCLGAFGYAYAQIYMFICSLPYLCLDLYAGVLFAMFVSRSTYWLLYHVLLQPFLSLAISLSYVLALQVGCRPRSYGLGLHPYTQAYIKRFRSFLLCMRMLACFYTLYPCLPAQIQVLPCLVPSVGLCLLVFRATCLCVVASVLFCGLFGCNHLREYILVMLICLMHTISSLCAMLCLSCLLCATCLAFFASLHFCTLAYMSMHESLLACVCRHQNFMMYS